MPMSSESCKRNGRTAAATWLQLIGWPLYMSDIHDRSFPFPHSFTTPQAPAVSKPAVTTKVAYRALSGAKALSLSLRSCKPSLRAGESIVCSSLKRTYS